MEAKKLAVTLTASLISHNCPANSVGSTFKYILNLTIFHHHHCYHPSPQAVIFCLGYHRSFPAAVLLLTFPFQSVLNTGARGILHKCKSDYVSSVQKTLQWLSISCKAIRADILISKARWPPYSSWEAYPPTPASRTLPLLHPQHRMVVF